MILELANQLLFAVVRPIAERLVEEAEIEFAQSADCAPKKPRTVERDLYVIGKLIAALSGTFPDGLRDQILHDIEALRLNGKPRLLRNHSTGKHA